MFQALKERKVAQWGLAYLAGAWALLQVADLVGARFGWPDTWLRILIVVMVAGFFAALVLAWYHGEKGRQRVSTVELGMLAALLALAGVGVAWVGGMAGADGTGSSAAGVSGAAQAGAGSEREQGSIAVLPFENLSPDPDNEYFSDGITEELLNVLAQLPELRVVSRTSAFAFKGKDVGIDSIARALNVRHVLEGSVRKAGEDVRITAQLIDAASGYHLWSETYDRELRDIFAVQDEISRRIVNALEIELRGDRATGPLAETQTRDPEAHTLLLRALHFAMQGSGRGMEKAADLLRQALERDSTYARAWAELANVLFYWAYTDPSDRARQVEEAHAAVERALALDPDLPDAHYARGSLLWVFEQDLPAAEAALQRAVDLKPGYARAYSRLAWVRMLLGREEEAIAASLRATELDPVFDGYFSNLGGMYAYADRPALAIEALETAISLNPSVAHTWSNLALTRVQAGDPQAAVADAERGTELGPDDQFTISTLAYVHGMAGNPAEARRALRALEAMEADAFFLATGEAGLGNTEKVFRLLEQALENEDPGMLDLVVDPVFDPYRDDPRMDALLERVGAAGD